MKILFWKLPTIYFIKEKQFYQYGSFINWGGMLRFINNILFPIVELKNRFDIDAFMDTSRNWVERNSFLSGFEHNIPDDQDFHLRVRMICFISNVEEYSGEYSGFLSNAEKIAYRNELRIGFVTDKELIKLYKSIYDGIWFNSHSWTSMVINRAGRYFYLDLSLMSEHLDEFMIYNSLSFVDELSGNNNFLTAKIKTPIALFFIDTIFIKENFHEQLKKISDIAQLFQGYYIFMYMDGNTRTETKEKLGLKKDAPLPTLVINYLYSNKQKQLPYTTPFNEKNIFLFLKENLGTGATDIEYIINAAI